MHCKKKETCHSHGKVIPPFVLQLGYCPSKVRCDMSEKSRVTHSQPIELAPQWRSLRSRRSCFQLRQTQLQLCKLHSRPWKARKDIRTHSRCPENRWLSHWTAWTKVSRRNVLNYRYAAFGTVHCIRGADRSIESCDKRRQLRTVTAIWNYVQMQSNI